LAKLALLALVLGVGACVADDPDSKRTLDTELGEINVVDEVETPGWGDDTVNPAIVIITGLEIPGRTPTTPNLDITNVDTRELDPQARRLCALAEGLPDSDVCSLLCEPGGFAARVFDNGSTGNCTEQRCNLPGGVSVQVDVCVDP
jgi:hypothetical protein